MTTQELSREYRHSADLLLPRLHTLRQIERRERDPEEAYRLWRRIVTLEAIRRQDMEIACHLERYGRETHK